MAQLKKFTQTVNFVRTLLQLHPTRHSQAAIQHAIVRLQTRLTAAGLLPGYSTMVVLSCLRTVYMK